MKLFAALDAKDRKLLLGCLATVLVLAVITAIFARNVNSDDNSVPSTYLTDRHGARAAYELLQASGYSLERWEQPLADLANIASAQTVVIVADPFTANEEDLKAVREIAERGGLVLVTGLVGGVLAPDNNVEPSTQFGAACKLTPEGFDPLAASGEVWMEPEATWGSDHPRDRVQYNCVESPAVVQYAVGKGRVIWWAGPTPLENGSITRAQNLDLFLNTLGPREGRHFYWDESLHGEIRTQWFYARGPAWNLLRGGLAAIALIIVLSFSRRRGPMRDLPPPVRATPVEFLEALGSLYAAAGASTTALELAYDRFRRKMGDLCGLQAARMNSEELGAALRRRFPAAPPDLEKDLADCEAAVQVENLKPKKALALIQALSRHSETLNAAARASVQP
jgi:hypothetical protein